MSGSARPLRVLLVGRRPIARAGLRGLLSERSDIVVIGESGRLDEAARLSGDLTPDVVLLEWDASEAGPIAELVETVGATGTPVVLLGDAPTARDLQRMLRSGLRGFVLPDATGEDLGVALEAVSQGLLVLDPLLGHTLATSTQVVPLADAVGDAEPLTEREREVLHLLALGLPNKTIANRLRVSEHTVKFHVGSILAKLGATSRTEAVTRAVRQGVLAL